MGTIKEYKGFLNTNERIRVSLGMLKAYEHKLIYEWLSFKLWRSLCLQKEVDHLETSTKKIKVINEGAKDVTS